MKAIGYTRVSNEEQAQEELNLSAQAERIRAYCKAQADGNLHPLP